MLRHGRDLSKALFGADLTPPLAASFPDTASCNLEVQGRDQALKLIPVKFYLWNGCTSKVTQVLPAGVVAFKFQPVKINGIEDLIYIPEQRRFKAIDSLVLEQKAVRPREALCSQVRKMPAVPPVAYFKSCDTLRVPRYVGVHYLVYRVVRSTGKTLSYVNATLWLRVDLRKFTIQPRFVVFEDLNAHRRIESADLKWAEEPLTRQARSRRYDEDPYMPEAYRGL